MVTSQDVQAYTPYTIAYAVDIKQNKSIFVSLGIGHTYHFYDHIPPKETAGFDFLNKYSMFKGNIAYEGEKHSIHLSFLYDEIFDDFMLDKQKMLAISYGRRF